MRDRNQCRARPTRNISLQGEDGLDAGRSRSPCSLLRDRYSHRTEILDLGEDSLRGWESSGQIIQCLRIPDGISRRMVTTVHGTIRSASLLDQCVQTALFGVHQRLH